MEIQILDLDQNLNWFIDYYQDFHTRGDSDWVEEIEDLLDQREDYLELNECWLELKNDHIAYYKDMFSYFKFALVVEDEVEHFRDWNHDQFNYPYEKRMVVLSSMDLDLDYDMFS